MKRLHKGAERGTKEFLEVGVSKNSGTPKLSILIGFSIINYPFWGITMFGNTQVFETPAVFFSGKVSCFLYTLPATNILLAPKHGWLEDQFLGWLAGRCYASFREGTGFLVCRYEWT